MTRELNEMQRVGLLRNALLVAGSEMGDNGDHWPVVNDCIHKIARDWEEHRLQRDADTEMKKQVYIQLSLMDDDITAERDPAIRAELKAKLLELHDLFDAYFCALDDKAAMPLNQDDIPDYIRRAEAIVETLGGSHD